MKDNQILGACEPAGTPLQSQTNPPDRILVVEDDPFLRQRTTKALLRAGYEVDSAADGAAAWGALKSESYDLMITDNNMPRLTGVELLMKLHSARMIMPVIMATGTFPAEEFAPRPWLQPEATLLKPYTVEEMLRTVKKVLRETDSTGDADELLRDRAMQAGNYAPPTEPASAALPGPATQPQRILVVDEDSDLRLLYADALARPGYCVDMASDGVAGWEALQANNYHLLITEHDMPNLTGVELIKKLRAARMALPVVMAAGRLPTHELAENPSLQVTATLLKPFEVEVLLATVKQALGTTETSQPQMAPLPIWQTQPPAVGLRL